VVSGWLRGVDPSPWFSAIPCLPNGDIYARVDYLKDDLSTRFFGGMHRAFAPVNAGRELARRFLQRLQGKRRLRFVAPRLEDLRMIIPMAMNVMPAIGIITVGRVIGLVMWRRVIELSGIKPVDR
jgi:hypothetical protein